VNHSTIRTLTVVLLWLGSFCADAQLVKDGYADLSNRTFNAPVDLPGTWEFYYGRLLTPVDFNTPQHPEWMPVPGSWHWHGKPVLGVATYRIRLAMPEHQHDLSLYFPIINSAARIWINGVLEEESGVVAEDQQHYSPKLSSTLVSLPEGVSNLDIIVQVSNFSFYEGGIHGMPQIEETSNIFNKKNLSNGVENFFAGSLIAMFIYQLILYFLFDRGKPYLWLSLICLGVAFRALIVHGGSFLLPNLIPSVDWEYWKKLEFGSVYAITAFFPLYVYHLFPQEAPRKLLYPFVGTAMVLCLAVVFTSQPVYGQLLDVGHLSLLMGFLYAIYSVGKAWKSGNKDARIILFGVLAAFPFILTEIIKNSKLHLVDIQFMYLVELGVLVFLLFQVYLLANHYSKSYKKLETLNLDLEKVVNERTRELTTANTVKDRLLSVISHDVKSPLNSLRGILRIYNTGAIKQEEFGKYSLQIEDDLNRTGLLVENILHWTSSQLKGAKMKREFFDLYSLIEENVDLFRTTATGKRITIHHDASKGMKVTSDRNVLNLVMRNLLANAIKFSHEGGQIHVLVKVEGHSLTIQVKDNGIGMDELAMQSVLGRLGKESTSGTGSEKGAGMGLTLCREFVLMAGGQITVESSHGKGSTFSVMIPIA
jgi:signal transduction histidine kinase